MYEVKENFITNVDDIMELVEKHELDNLKKDVGDMKIMLSKILEKIDGA